MQNVLNKVCRLLIDYGFTRPRKCIELIKQKERYSSNSYYPEKKPSSSFSNFLYQFNQIWKYGASNKYFFMYGLDVKPKEERKEYVNFLHAFNRVCALNFGSNAHNSTCILRNKFYFDIFAKGIGVCTPKIKAYYSQGKLFLWNNGFREVPFSTLAKINDCNLFCKETEGECGMGIFILKVENEKLFINGSEISIESLEQKLLGAEYLFQEVVEQHEDMNKLYSGSINTLRLITVRSLKDNKYYVMPSILRIGANGSCVDNTSQGGFAVGFDLKTGRLNEYGFQKPQFGLKSDRHPDSGIKFSEFIIPYFQEAIDAALYFHSMLKDIQSVGWDIAIGKQGPIFIEGNDNWEINGPQVGNHGLRKEFEEYFYK